MNLLDLPNDNIFDIIMSMDNNLTISILSLVCRTLNILINNYGLINPYVLKYHNILRLASKTDQPGIIDWITTYRKPTEFDIHDMHISSISGGAINTLKYLETQYPLISIRVDRLRMSKITYTADIYRYLNNKGFNIWNIENIPLATLTDEEIYNWLPHKIHDYLIEYVLNLYDITVSNRIMFLIIRKYGKRLIIESLQRLVISEDRIKELQDIMQS